MRGTVDQRSTLAVGRGPLTWAQSVELAASLVLVAFAARFMWLMARTLLDGRLWTDELHSILHYRSQGPVTTATTYNEANNHVFFNLVNSITPGAESYDPARARIWAVLAVTAMAALILYEFFRRRWYFAGAVGFTLVAANEPFLDLAMQGRGYGFQGLAAVVVAFSVWRYLEDGRERWLVALALATFLGTWTIPTFVIFAGGAMVLLALVARNMRVVAYGAVTLAAIVAVHLLIVGDMLNASRVWEEQVGRIFGWDGPYGTLETWLLSEEMLQGRTVPWPAVVAGGLAFLVLLVVAPVSSAVRRAAAITVAALAVLIASALAIGSTVDRTLAFVGISASLVVLMVLSDLIYRPGRDFGRLLGGALVVLASVGLVAQNQEDFSYVERERWSDAATYIADVLPAGTIVGATKAYPFIDVHLGEDFPVVAALEDVPLADGGGAIVNFRVGDAAVDADALPPLVAEHLFPQRRGAYMSVIFAPPADSVVGEVRVVGDDGTPVPELYDGDGDTTAALPSGTTLAIAPNDGTSVRSLVLVFDEEQGPAEVRAQVRTAEGSDAVESEEVFLSPTTATIVLGDREIDAIEVTLVSGGDPVTVRDLWLTTPA